MTPTARWSAGLSGAALALATSRFAGGWLRSRPPAETDRWRRLNYRGHGVSLLEGPATATGLVVSGLAAPGLPAGARVAATVAVGAAAAAGAYDDLREAGSTKGIRGHLRLLRQRQVSTGAVKVAAITGSAWAAARALDPTSCAPQLLADGVLIAGTANLVNLFDLRPGRALKVSLLGAGALAATSAPAALLGAIGGVVAAALPGDLAERTMLGDCGANALGAALGCAAVAAGHRGVRVGGAVLVVSLTMLSERASFSALIARSRPLTALDRLGRPLPAQPDGVPSPPPAGGC